MSAVRSRETVLVLGGGDGMVARELLKYPDVQHIILVDLDPAMTDLARTFAPLREVNGDSLNDPRVTVVNTDAYKFIEESDELYSVVIIDLPDPNNESLSKLYSQQFYRLLRLRLTPDGAFVTQAASPYFVRQAFWSIVHTIEASDFEIIPLRTYVPSFGEWGFVIGVVRGQPQLEVPPNLDLRYLTPDVLIAAQAFDPDIAEQPADINTLNNPVLYHYYEQGWRLWD
jgi:spermidine synthase